MKHSFYWDTAIPMKRQREINAWLASLNDTQEKMLNELLRDVRADAEFDAREEDY